MWIDRKFSTKRQRIIRALIFGLVSLLALAYGAYAGQGQDNLKEQSPISAASAVDYPPSYLAAENDLGDHLTAVATQEENLREPTRGQHEYALVARIPAIYWYVAVVALLVLPVLLAFFLWSRSLRKQVASRTKQLHESERLLAAIIDGIAAPVFYKNAAGVYLGCNEAFSKFLGLPKASIIGKKAFDIAPSDLARQYHDADLTLMKEGNVQVYEAEVVDNSGARRHVMFHKSPFRDPAGKIDGIVGAMLDITERKLAEEALRKRDDYIGVILDNLPIGIAVNSVDPVVKFEYMNDNFPKFYRTTRESLAELDLFWDAVYKEPAFKEEIRKRVLDDCASGDPARMRWEDVPIARQGVETAFITAQNIPIPNKQLMISTVWDVTERKRTERALAESEERYRTAIEYSNDGVAILKGKTHIYVNRKYLDIFGYTQAEEILNRSFLHLVHPDERDWVLELSERRAKDDSVPSRYECKGIKKNGDPIFVEVSVARTSYRGEAVSLGFFRDTTKRRKAEEERILLAAAIEHASESVLITDLNGSIQYVNPICEEITGYLKDELIGQNPGIFQSGKHERSFYQSLWANLNQGRMWKGHFVNKRKDGSLYEEDATISPVINEAGKITNYVAVKRDATEDIRREKQLRQARKMEAIGTLAGGIAHDFNNILSAVIGYSEIALDRIQNDEKLKDHLQEILNAGVRARDLVKQILTFSRQSEQEMQPVKVKLIVKEVLKLLRASLPATIEIRQTIESDGIVMADPTQIHQILMNLCTNAAHAMRQKGGLLSVSLTDLQVTASMADRYPGAAPGPYQVLAVGDTGHGMSADVVEKIFDPFFTTKAKEEGTGMGLSVVDGIVKGHGGLITVESEPGKGTKFQVYFPIARKSGRLEAEIIGPLPSGDEHILLVDDEKPLADIGRLMLERQGYRVTTRTSSIEALELFKAKADHFDLVLTDLMMPNMTGLELARELLKIRPDIATILCTGFSENLTEETLHAAGIRALLLKPMTAHELAHAVRKVLDLGIDD